MKLKHLAFAIGIFGFFVSQVSCKKDKVPEPFLTDTCPDTVSFQTTIKTIIDVNCSTSGCHDASASGNLELLTHAQINARAEDILLAIRHQGGFSPMPLGSPKLADSIGDQISCWISQGKLNN